MRIQLARVQQQVPSAAPLLLPAESAQLELVAAGHPLALGSGPQAAAADEWRAGALLEWALSDDNWMHSAPLEAAVQLPLLRLAAHYLLRERRRCAGKCWATAVGVDWAAQWGHWFLSSVLVLQVCLAAGGA